MTLKTHVIINPSTMRDIPHGLNINSPLSWNEGKPLKMCFLHEPTRWLKSLKELSGRDKFCTSRQEGDQGTEPNMGHIRFSMSRAWSSLLLQSRQSPQILTLTRLLVMKDLFIYLFSFSPLHQKGPEQARANYNFLLRLFGNEHEKALPVSLVSPTPLSRWK